MSQKTLPQSIFGDQTNIKRCVQPPGGNSSIMFGGDSAKCDAVKGKNHQASDIFNLDENKEATKKPAQSHHGDTQSRCFGGENSKTTKGDDAHKSFNPITGEAVQSNVTKKEEEHEKKDAETVRYTITSCITTTTTTTNASAAAGISTRPKQPPGGKSTKLW